MPEDAREPGEPEASNVPNLEAEKPSEGAGATTAAPRKIDKQQDWFVHRTN